MARRRKKRNQNRASRLKEATVHIPLTYNDGTKIPQKMIYAIRDEIFAVFGGWTIRGTVRGAYRMESGKQIVEDLEEILLSQKMVM